MAHAQRSRGRDTSCSASSHRARSSRAVASDRRRGAAPSAHAAPAPAGGSSPDDAGDEHEVRLERLGGHAAEAVVLATHRPVRESSLDLVLAPALLKGAKMELVIEKATELGVRRIAPVLARHAIGRPPAGDRLGRWRRIALAAAKQSGRTRVPELDAPAPLAALVRRDWPGLRLIAWKASTTSRSRRCPRRRRRS
jgi:RsmE family RNA methyltransferase